MYELFRALQTLLILLNASIYGTKYGPLKICGRKPLKHLKDKSAEPNVWRLMLDLAWPRVNRTQLLSPEAV